MATSGAYTNSMDLADYIDEAFERCGIDPATVEGRHLRSARRSIELMFSEWATRGIHLWAVEQHTEALVQSTATYNTPTGTVAVLEMVVRRDGLDTDVEPIARDEYLDIPDKTEEGLPSQFYYDRQRDTPTITLWTVPENSTDEIIYYRLRRLQDGGALSNTPDVPYFWNEAFAAGLAAKLAEKYAPEREDKLVLKARMAFDHADEEDRQRMPTTTKVRYRNHRRR